MCGLAGFIHWDGEPAVSQELEAMAATLRHRGPDEFSLALPSAWVGFSHCRLKVIDLSSRAKQPMANAERSLWICFNGEIYNFRQLREELEAKGFHFLSRSDTEVILHAYAAWGSEAFARLDGMFAIALWDQRTGKLFLVRDRTGKKPLYYWTDGRCLAFASEIKALLAHRHVPQRINESVLPFLFALGYPPAGGSCYEEIHQVLPASWLHFSAQTPNPTPRTYWTLPTDPPQPCPVEEASAQLRRHFGEAVARRLISDVPLGAFLSGGLDSTLVVGLMATQMEQPVRTFSIGFEGDTRFNEVAFARLAAAHFQTSHTEFIVRPQPFELLERIVWHLDQPFGDSSVVPTYLLAQLARGHVTVALTGDGGDELFAGYDRFRAAILSEHLPPWARTLGSQLTRLIPSGSHPRSLSGRIRRFLEVASEPLADRFLRWSGYFPNPGQVLRSTNGYPWTGLRLEPDSSAQSLLERLLRFNFREYLPNDLLVKMDRCSMAHGLEVRSPFLHTELIEWAFRLPDSLKLRGGVTKWILRHTFRDLVPHPILRRGKMGFGVPLGAWFRTQWRDPLQDTLGSPQARSLRYFRREAIQNLIDTHLRERGDVGQRLWLLLTFELWLRQEVVSPSRPA